MDIEKRDDETQLQYHKRLIFGKLVDKTLADVDYSELAELAYGQPYSSDCARRMFYGSKRTLELLEEERTDDLPLDLLTELDSKMVELKKERQRFYDMRREYNKNIITDAREEHLYDTLEQAAQNLSATIGDLYPGTDYHGDDSRGTEAVLVFSDWHYGLKADNAFNKFDTASCIDRVRYVTQEAAARISFHNCHRLHIVVLGDLFHGAIHTSARVASEELVCDQIMQVSEILAQSIQYLSQYVRQTDVYLTYGNHARTVQQKKDSIHRDNMERLIPWWLKARLSADDKIVVHEDSGTEFVFANVCGHDLVAVHGDNDTVKSSTRILPSLLNKKYGLDIEYILLGDKHHRESFEEFGCTTMMCGSLCGADDYANNKRMYSTPSQLLLIVTEEDGVDAEYRLKCG